MDVRITYNDEDNRPYEVSISSRLFPRDWIHDSSWELEAGAMSRVKILKAQIARFVYQFPEDSK